MGHLTSKGLFLRLSSFLHRTCLRPSRMKCIPEKPSYLNPNGLRSMSLHWLECAVMVTACGCCPGSGAAGSRVAWALSLLDLKKSARLNCEPYVIRPSVVDSSYSRYLSYLTYLIAFLHVAPSLHRLDLGQLPSKMPGVPQVVLNGLLARFAEGGPKKYTFSDRTRTKLHGWICVVYLAASDEWAIDLQTVESDLKIPAKK